jgi:hypothetical protein
MGKAIIDSNRRGYRNFQIFKKERTCVSNADTQQLIQPAHWFIALAITYEDSDIRNIKALIVGPPGTPYEFGFFEVSVPPLIHVSFLITSFCHE